MKSTHGASAGILSHDACVIQFYVPEKQLVSSEGITRTVGNFLEDPRMSPLTLHHKCQ